MKAVKKLFVCFLVAAPLLMIPATSRAGIIGDILNGIFGNTDKDKKPDPKPGNSVPLDGGMVILLAAGLGLGAKKIYDKRKAEPKAV
jgi:hypothetical protein